MLKIYSEIFVKIRIT